MRVKFQMRNEAGIFSDVILDPEQGHVLAMEIKPEDMMYIARRAQEHKGKSWLHIGAMPMRIKTSLSAGGKGNPVDIIVDRGAGDWLAIELMPVDLHRLARCSSGGEGKYPRIWATRKSAGFTDQMRAKFMSDWPELSTKCPDAHPDMMLGGAPAYMLGRETEANAFRAWVDLWPPVFHSTEYAPVASLILPDGSRHG